MLPLLVAAALHLSTAAAPTSPSPPARPDGARAANASDRTDVSEVPPDQRARHALFQQKCAKCHALSIASASRLTEGQLRRHLRRPGVALSAAQAQAIAEYLTFQAARRASP